MVSAGCLLLGYGLSKDLHALQMHHPENMQKDLMHSPKFQSGRAAQARKLQDIALEFLGSNIQSSKHSAR